MVVVSVEIYPVVRTFVESYDTLLTFARTTHTRKGCISNIVVHRPPTERHGRKEKAINPLKIKKKGPLLRSCLIVVVSLSIETIQTKRNKR